MELIVLGAQGWPGPGGACSGYLLRHEGHHLVMDLGNGTLAELQRYCTIRQIDAICISHCHPDHFADLYSVWVAVAFGEDPDGVQVHAPPPFLDTMGALMSEESRATLGDTFPLHPTQDGDVFDVGPFHVQAFGMHHPTEAVGFRVTAGGRTLAYSGDTGPHDGIDTLARDADLFLCEATYQDAAPADYPFHLTGSQAGAAAARAKAGRLVLTHTWPTQDTSITIAQAREHYDGPVDVAVTGLRMEV